MAGVIGKSGATGRNFNDRERASRVRNLALDEIEGILNKKIKVSKEFRNQIVLKLAGQVLPRLNELSGEDGGPLTVQIIKYANDTSTT